MSWCLVLTVLGIQHATLVTAAHSGQAVEPFGGGTLSGEFSREYIAGIMLIIAFINVNILLWGILFAMWSTSESGKPSDSLIFSKSESLKELRNRDLSLEASSNRLVSLRAVFRPESFETDLETKQPHLGRNASPQKSNFEEFSKRVRRASSMSTSAGSSTRTSTSSNRSRRSGSADGLPSLLKSEASSWISKRADCPEPMMKEKQS